MRDSHTSLDEVIKVLTDNPHISELHLFGSRATEKSDELSDIDLTATSPHPAAAEAYARKSLADKFGLSAVYTIKNDEHEIARTFCLSGMSPFHKIDIGFSLPSEVKFFPNSRLILKNNKPQKPSIEFKKWTEPRAEHDYFDVMMGARCATSSTAVAAKIGRHTNATAALLSSWRMHTRRVTHRTVYIKS